MKKWLPIIMLTSAIVVPGLNAEAATNEQPQQKVHYTLQEGQNCKVLVNGEEKELKNLNVSPSTLQSIISKLSRLEGTSVQGDQGSPKAQAPAVQAPKAEEKAPAAPSKKVAAPQQPVQKNTASTPAKPTQAAAPAAQKTATEAKPASTGLSAYEQQVVDLTNAERQKAGLQPLAVDTTLSKSAHDKSADMAKNNYFDHTSPTYGSPFDQMKANGISYRSAGENIAKGQQTPAEVVKAWMESPGHRANILNKNFTHIGVGFVENGSIWTQQFIQK